MFNEKTTYSLKANGSDTKIIKKLYFILDRNLSLKTQLYKGINTFFNSLLKIVTKVLFVIAVEGNLISVALCEELGEEVLVKNCVKKLSDCLVIYLICPCLNVKYK